MRKPTMRALLVALGTVAAAAMFAPSPASAAITTDLEIRDARPCDGGAGPAVCDTYSAVVANVGAADLPARNSSGVGGYVITIEYPGALTPRSSFGCVVVSSGRCRIDHPGGLRKNTRGPSPVIGFTTSTISQGNKQIVFRVGVGTGVIDVGSNNNRSACPLNS